jgi:hypothetical protein
MEDALKRLDKLTHEEARMATAEVLRATHVIDERVHAVDDRVASVDDKVAEVINGAQIIFSQAFKIVQLNLSDGKEAKQVMDQTANDVDQVKRLSSRSLISTDYGALHIVSENQLWENIHKWLSPPDPSTNHNIACATHHKKTATWFFQGSIFREWKSTGSLLWIYGKRARPAPPLTRYSLITS